MSDFEIIENELDLNLNEIYDDTFSRVSGQEFVLTGEFRRPRENENFLRYTGTTGFDEKVASCLDPDRLHSHPDYGDRRPIVKRVDDDDHG